MSSLYSLFLIVPLAFIAFVVYSIFSKKGRNKYVGLTYGEVIEDLGTLKDQQLKLGVTQKARLLRCRQNGEEFFVIEAALYPPGSDVFWTKIDDEMLQQVSQRIQKH